MADKWLMKIYQSFVSFFQGRIFDLSFKRFKARSDALSSIITDALSFEYRASAGVSRLPGCVLLLLYPRALLYCIGESKPPLLSFALHGKGMYGHSALLMSYDVSAVPLLYATRCWWREGGKSSLVSCWCAAYECAYQRTL
jgi:hypothetical protein